MYILVLKSSNFVCDVPKCDPGPQNKGHIFEIEISTSSESWLNKLSLNNPVI